LKDYCVKVFLIIFFSAHSPEFVTTMEVSQAPKTTEDDPLEDSGAVTPTVDGGNKGDILYLI
jgi:hypothetical protein